MFDDDQYELVDFGKGRKLERFGRWLLDRPCPAADDQMPAKPKWDADASYRRSASDPNKGRWKAASKLGAMKALSDGWTVRHGRLLLTLKPTPFGHVGVFPEQATNWDWIARQVARAPMPTKVLNLFGYTGASTLAAAAAGAEVTHVDASKSVVRWARDNAEKSGLSEAPIRWIHEDALKFVRREIKRERKYDAVIMDPPTYGHGAGGEVWKIHQHLPELLEACAEVTRGSLRFMLLTCHTPGLGPAELEALMADRIFGTCQAGAQAKRVQLFVGQRKLDCGVLARWPSHT